MKKPYGTTADGGDIILAYWPQVRNPFLTNVGIGPARTDLMPLKFLIRQAGWAGYLLFLGDLLQFVFRRQRAAAEYASVDDGATIQILYVVVCFVYAGWYLASPRNRQVSGLLLSNPMVFLVLYIVLCLVSALWSPNPMYSAFMAFQCLSFLMLVVAAVYEVNRRCSSQDVIEWVMLWVVWTISWSVLFSVRSFGVGYLFSAARLSSGVFFFLALYLCKRRLFGWLVVAFTMLAGARKNYWGIIPGLLFGAVLGDRKSKVLAFAFAGTLTIFILFFGVEDVIQNTLFRGKEGIGWEYTSGRDRMWTLGWELCMQRPLLGYGFVASERDVLSEMMGQSAQSMHNMLLSAFMAVGFLGPLLLLSYLLGTWILCLSRAILPSWRFAFMATILMVFVVAMTDPGLGGRVYGSWLPSVVVMTAIVILCKNRARGPASFKHQITPLMAVGRALH
jgi:hypothetical protein